MSLYVDSSALLKRYVAEPESARCDEILRTDPTWVTARHTWVEVLRNLARLLEGQDLVRLEKAFRADWRRMYVVELDRVTCERAAELARSERLRTLDALHLAAAYRMGGGATPFLTYDVRQAQAARALGMPVLGG